MLLLLNFHNPLKRTVASFYNYCFPHFVGKSFTVGRHFISSRQPLSILWGNAMGFKSYLLLWCVTYVSFFESIPYIKSQVV